MQFNLCGLIQMLLPLRYELNYRPEDNLMEAWELDDWPQYYVWDHVALALHVESGQVRSLRSSRRALLQIQLHRRVHLSSVSFSGAEVRLRSTETEPQVL